jgi:hypothetical protein
LLQAVTLEIPNQADKAGNRTNITTPTVQLPIHRGDIKIFSLNPDYHFLIS